MSIFIDSIPPADLSERPPGVEGDPLAHQHHVGHPAVDLHRVGRLVGGPDQTGRLGRSPGHAEQPAQSFVGDPLLVPHLEGHAGLCAQLLLGDLGQTASASSSSVARSPGPGPG